MQSSHEKYQLKEVINASGKMTILGVSKVSKNVQNAQIEGGNNFYEMSELMSQTGRYIAKLVGSEGAQVVSSASAGIAQSVAAVIGKGSRYHLYHPYEDRGEAREIIIPKGHNVDYGTGIDLMIAQGGGKVVEAGYANRCTSEDIEMMITDKTAAILYVKSHHTVQKSMLAIQEAIEVAHRHNLPLILDAAAEEELSYYVELGADLIIFSGAKAIEGPSSGLVVGKQPYMEWVSLQSLGMARSMKIGKENVLGFTQAIEDYLANGSEDGESMKHRLIPFLEDLNTVPGITATCVQDGAGREIYRAEVKVAENLNAKEIIGDLKAESPAVYTREYRANNGIIEFDIRAVSKNEMNKIVDRLREIVAK
ncbi:DgaE family pyridoxal phosphate-dependent ammonia lyase [Vagococcus sp. PNs007]|uniref:DgaE family pyridoxal phosphate-dependent ammonia lyase n=1 Tax=Vagococcus proximus TaxID=2991417 RepID=A0ABT5WY75_9ENTE|nr:DgaE family pyridoxal phosphate-dependent ammonia lyase [Vagococcus proximus]MDF0478713.1 DgaE family pyridoxal phosphate-dependent ammonia lyase [Vagococcus proximus]